MESSTFTYDIAGRKTTTVNKRGDTTIESRDAIGRVIEARQNLVATDFMSTRYGYDAAGNLSSLTDGRGKVTTYTFNPCGTCQGV